MPRRKIVPKVGDVFEVPLEDGKHGYGQVLSAVILGFFTIETEACPSPEEVVSQVTKRIEEVVNTISGIDELRSTTIEGQSPVFVSFILDRDIESAAQDVREKIAPLRPILMTRQSRAAPRGSCRAGAGRTTGAR